MALPRTVRAIYDTDEGVVHVPDVHTFTESGIENIDEFVAWLNTKAKQERFTVITATPLTRTARGGMNRRYADYLKGQPEVRIRAALSRLVEQATNGYGIHPVSLVRRGGGWTVPHAIESIQKVAGEANVPFNDARTVFLRFLRRELGEVILRGSSGSTVRTCFGPTPGSGKTIRPHLWPAGSSLRCDFGLEPLGPEEVGEVEPKQVRRNSVVMDRATFPPEDAVRPEDDAHDRDGHEAYPVNL